MTENGENDGTATGTEWWRDAVIYQIYPRSFADADGDGIGDLPGIIARLPHVAALGADAVWLSPFYPSPQRDAGYDVSDYRNVEPLFGTLADAEHLLAEAHRLSLRVIVDLVPNHTSDRHRWFQDALSSPDNSPERARYLFRPGTGPNGDQPPNDWLSVFGGAAWSRAPGEKQWYLHLFDSSQPDLDWQNPEVWEEFRSVLRFWLDRGVDGFRIDVAHGMIKAPGLPDWPAQATMVGADGGINRGPMWDQDGVHAIYRDWREVLDAYPGDRMMVAEAWVQPQERLARYLRPGEMQQAFNFDYLLARWDADNFRRVIDESLAAAGAVGAPATWVTSNHDTVRYPSRLGLSHPGARPKGIAADDEQPDQALGLKRARACALLTLALPGSAYLYQGEELGLPEHTELDHHFRQDPAFHRTNGAETGRDGCRVPIPWEADAPAYGFNHTGASWLPQPDGFRAYAVDRQERDADSTLHLHRRLLALRREHRLGRGTLCWLPDFPPASLGFDNGPVRIVLNLGPDPIPLPAGRPLASSFALPGDDTLPPDTAVWLLVEPPSA